MPNTDPRHRVEIPVFGSSQARELIKSQLGTAWYEAPASERSAKNIHGFRHERDFWAAVLNGQITDNCFVELEDFSLSEWIPLRPGLFHTDPAYRARESAVQNARFFPDPEQPETPKGLDRYSRTVLGYEKGIHAESVVLFDPYAQMSMIQGGVGCIRLKPLSVKEEYRWLMCACSSAVMHAGVPVKLTNADYQRIYDDIRKHGSFPCRLSGY